MSAVDSHQKTKQESRERPPLKAERREKKEPIPVLQSIEELSELPVSVRAAREEDTYYRRHKNPDGSIGGFVANSRIADDVYVSPDCVISSSKVRNGTEIGTGVKIYSSTIGRNNVIGKASELSNVETGDRVSIGDGCFITSRNTGEEDGDDSVTIEGNVKIGDEVEITNAYICTGVEVGDDSILDGFNQVYIGKRAKIGSSVKVEDAAMLQPDATVPDGSTVLRHTTVDNFKVPKGSVKEAMRKLSPRKD